MDMMGLTDIRIVRPPRWEWIDALPTLVSIDLAPPASGPEIELTFAIEERLGEWLRKEVERVTGHPVLAIRRRPAA